jgi:hypothetical protein
MTKGVLKVACCSADTRCVVLSLVLALVLMHSRDVLCHELLCAGGCSLAGQAGGS